MADAPELLEGLQFFVLRPMEEASLVAQARAVFLSIAILLILTTFPTTNQVMLHDGKIEGVTKFSKPCRKC